MKNLNRSSNRKAFNTKDFLKVFTEAFLEKIDEEETGEEWIEKITGLPDSFKKNETKTIFHQQHSRIIYEPKTDQSVEMSEVEIVGNSVIQKL